LLVYSNELSYITAQFDSYEFYNQNMVVVFV